MFLIASRSGFEGMCFPASASYWLVAGNPVPAVAQVPCSPVYIEVLAPGSAIALAGAGVE